MYSLIVCDGSGNVRNILSAGETYTILLKPTGEQECQRHGEYHLLYSSVLYGFIPSRYSYIGGVMGERIFSGGHDFLLQVPKRKKTTLTLTLLCFSLEVGAPQVPERIVQWKNAMVRKRVIERRVLWQADRILIARYKVV